MRKNKNILKKGMILAAVSTMVVTMAPAIPAYVNWCNKIACI